MRNISAVRRLARDLGVGEWHGVAQNGASCLRLCLVIAQFILLPRIVQAGSRVACGSFSLLFEFLSRRMPNIIRNIVLYE